MFEVFAEYGQVVNEFLKKQKTQLKSSSDFDFSELNDQITKIEEFSESYQEFISQYRQVSNLNTIEISNEDQLPDESQIRSLIDQTEGVNKVRKSLGIDNSFYQEMLENLITKFSQLTKRFEEMINESDKPESQSTKQEKLDKKIFEELKRLLENFKNKTQEPEKKVDLTSIQPSTDENAELIKKSLQKSLEEGFRTFNKLGEKNSSVNNQTIELISNIRNNCNIAMKFLDAIPEEQLSDSTNISQLKTKISELAEICSQDFASHEQADKKDPSKSPASMTLQEIIEEKKHIDSQRKQRAGLNTQYQDSLNNMLDLNYAFSKSILSLSSNSESITQNISNADEEFKKFKVTLENILEKFKKTRSSDAPSAQTSEARGNALSESSLGKRPGI
jgi:hypothetical protein